MKITAKLFAIVTIAFGLNEASEPDHKIDYTSDIEHSQEIIDSGVSELMYIKSINDSLINKYCPYAEE